MAQKCIGCTRAAAPNRSRCFRCLESIRAARARYAGRNGAKIKAAEHAAREQRKAAGLCIACGAPAAHRRTRCAECLGKHRAGNDARRTARKASGACRQCGAPAAGRAYCRACLGGLSDKNAALRAEVIKAYGGRCECCGEDEPRFLQIDHANDDGAAHREVLGGSSKSLYRWLKRHSFPREGFRLLCANCNLGRYLNGGTCPHKTGDQT